MVVVIMEMNVTVKFFMDAGLVVGIVSRVLVVVGVSLGVSY
jgi:hypothetical protein